MPITTPVSECLYCQKNELFHSLMIKICDLEVSELLLFKEQTYKGRCIVAFKEHSKDLHDLTDSKRNAFMRDVTRTAKAIEAVFNQSKMNYGSFGDSLTHLHMHIVPKYKDGHNFGSMFEMNPKSIYLSDSEYTEIIEQIKSKL